MPLALLLLLLLAAALLLMLCLPTRFQTQGGAPYVDYDSMATRSKPARVKAPVLQVLAEKGYRVCNKKTKQPCDALAEALLGRGAFGSTYVILNPVEGVHKAVKVVDLEQAASKHDMSEKNLLKEVHVMMKMSNPHLVEYFHARWLLALYPPHPSLPYCTTTRRCVAVLLCCCVAVLLCCCVAVMLCCCVAVLLCVICSSLQQVHVWPLLDHCHGAVQG